MAIETETYSALLLRKPDMYTVFMLNDDYTSWEFCLRIITSVFHKTVEEADTITHDIHTKGRGVCGIYLYEVAETKAKIVETQARKEGFPMRCRIEPS